MLSIFTSVIAVIAAYLIGSLSFAIIVSRLMGINDPRTFGSGNPGATNVLRSGSKKAALLTLLLDAIKGYIPVVLAIWLAPWLHWLSWTVAAIAIAAFAGHLYPLYFHFKGGKGVATSAGILFAISPWLGLAIVIIWLAIAILTRYSSLAALMSAAATPLVYLALSLLTTRTPFSLPILMAIIIMVLMLIYKHKANIHKLLNHQESRIGQKKKDEYA